jgi:DNA mismatch repair protein MutS
MEETAIEQKTSPMMVQWHACKKMAKNAILFFRLGDFYEAFYEDAALISKELDLTLTQRHEVPMSGVPHHCCDSYIDKLVSKGYRVAVAEQMEDPKKTKGIVSREVVRIVTAGTLINSELLSDKCNNYFACVTQVGALFGLAFLDLTTGEFRVIELENISDLLNEIYRIHPSELLVSERFKTKHLSLFEELNRTYAIAISEIEDWHFGFEQTHNGLINHFNVHSLDSFGLKGAVVGIGAAGALINYLKDQLNLPVEHIRQILPLTNTLYMSLDRTAQRNLELVDSAHSGGRVRTLLGVLDHTFTPMGGRLLRRWVMQPLLVVEEIHRRQDCVEVFFKDSKLLEKIGECLDKIRDLERLMMRISSGYASPRDLSALCQSLVPVPHLRAALQSSMHIPELLQEHIDHLIPLPDLVEMISQALVDQPPIRLQGGPIFREGFNSGLDELREISRDSKSWIARYQTQLKEQTGIKTLKVGFNRMFGYYIEVSKGQTERMPSSFERRQTLVNAERYITPELKDYEAKVLNAEERMSALESELFNQLRLEAIQYGDRVLAIAKALAHIDCLCSLAQVAREQNYIRPIMDQSALLQIVSGRHPVIEVVNKAEKFIPNDTLMDGQDSRLLIITGPNMAGKSTYIRQVALIVIMAQIGSFIPAKSAQMGVVDKVFTRIGASDDLARGQSTFMVEMTETANILHNATSRSLVILDEIGRGTSTYDGISIAWAVAEHLLNTEGKQAKTLFATHYWELTQLEGKTPGAVNYHVAVQEDEENISFLRKIVRGGTDKSYGIHVGRLAGLPRDVLTRAKEILLRLEESSAQKKSPNEKVAHKTKIIPQSKMVTNSVQLSFFGDT